MNRNWLSWPIVPIALGLLLLSLTCLFAVNHGNQTPEKKGAVHEIAPPVENELDTPVETPETQQNPTQDLIAAMAENMPPGIVLVAFLCCIFFGPRWLRMSMCLVLLATLVSCGRYIRTREKPPEDCNWRIAGGYRLNPRTETFQRNITK